MKKYEFSDLLFHYGQVKYTETENIRKYILTILSPP